MSARDDAYNDLYEQIKNNCSVGGHDTNGGLLTGHGVHLVNHLDQAYFTLSDDATYDELESAYELELECCGVCQS